MRKVTDISVRRLEKQADDVAGDEPLIVRLVYKDAVTGIEELWATYTILAPGEVLVEQARRKPEVQMTWGDD